MVIVEGGAIKPLIDLCENGNDGSQIHAAATLATIATTKKDFQDKIVTAGAIPPLVKLLKMGSNKAMTHAAEAVAAAAADGRAPGAWCGIMPDAENRGPLPKV